MLYRFVPTRRKPRHTGLEECIPSHRSPAYAPAIETSRIFDVRGRKLSQDRRQRQDRWDPWLGVVRIELSLLEGVDSVHTYTRDNSSCLQMQRRSRDSS